MVLETKMPVSILYANTRELEGHKAVGQIDIELPDDKVVQGRMKEFLDKKNVTYWEVQ